MTPTTPLLHIDDLTKTYHDGTETVWACNKVTLDVHPGELVWLRGASGSGKSTLLMAAAGLLEPDTGTITLAGQPHSTTTPTTRARTRLTTIGVIFQDYLLLDEFTAAENVMLPLEAQGRTTTDARTEAHHWLDVVGLTGLADRRPHQLSGGQRQRVAIARALVGGKTLILADEPTGALDSTTTRGIFELLRTLADQGIAIVMASHDPSFAGYADTIYDVTDGTITPDPTRTSIH